jgi:ankyrin repeat protein
VAKKKRYESLEAAIQADDAESVRRLLADGADPNAVEEADDVTPLMYAAAAGELEIVEALVGAGADVNALANDFSGDLDEFGYVAEAFADAELYGLFALAYAVIYRHDEVFEYLSPLTSEELREQALGLRKRRDLNEAERT